MSLALILGKSWLQRVQAAQIISFKIPTGYQISIWKETTTAKKKNPSYITTSALALNKVNIFAHNKKR